MTDDPATLERQWLAFRQARRARLVAPDGWLALVDRIPLAPGENPLEIGVVVVGPTGVTLRPRPGLALTSAGAAVVTAMPWRSDQNAMPDVFVHGQRQWELIQHGAEYAVRVRDPGSPARATFGELDYFPFDPAWRLPARFTPYDPPREVQYEYELGPGNGKICPGLLTFEVAGRTLQLRPTLERNSGQLFVPFGDQTNPDQTYPAGRFLYASLPLDGVGVVLLDFNRAFNPPCAFSPYTVCPLAPPENRLPVRVEAGERRYRSP